MADAAVQEVKALLAAAAVRVRELEAEALEALQRRGDKDAHRACLEEKCRLLMGLPEAAGPRVAAMADEEAAAGVLDGLDGFARRAATAMRLGSVFFMGALLYPEDYRDGEPNDLERFADRM